jgi:F-type H+-transporting ATPase subunit epsilon
MDRARRLRTIPGGRVLLGSTPMLERDVVAKPFRCKLVTPAAALVDDKVVYASIPAYDGLMGVQSGHAPTLTKLGMGELRIDLADDAKIGKGGSRSFLLDGGFVKIADDELTILAEMATPCETISLSDAEKELKLALDAKPKDASPAAAAAVSHQRSLARMKVSLAKSSKSI